MSQQQLKTLFTLVVIVALINLVSCSLDGWPLTDGNIYRNRFLPDDDPSRANTFSMAFGGWELVPRSLVMQSDSKLIYGLARIDYEDRFVEIRKSGSIRNIATFPSESGGGYGNFTDWVKDVAPLLDAPEGFGGSGCYFSVRRSSRGVIAGGPGNQTFVVKSCVKTATNTIMDSTIVANTAITGMIILNFNSKTTLVILSGNKLISLDPMTGSKIWSIDLSGFVDGSKCKFFAESDQLLIFGENIAYQIDASRGTIQSKVVGDFYVNGQQEFFALTDLLGATNIGTIQKTQVGYVINVYSARKLYLGIQSSYLLRDQFNVPIDLSVCSNILSSSIYFNFLCQRKNSPPYVYSFSSKTAITPSYEKNLNAVYGVPIKACSHQIASYSKNRWGVACDNGLMSFRSGDKMVFSRSSFQIPVNTDTQVFGTNSRYFILTPEFEKSWAQALLFE